LGKTHVPNQNSLFIDTSGRSASVTTKRRAKTYQQAQRSGRIIVSTNSELSPVLCARLHVARAQALASIKSIRAATFTEIIAVTPEIEEQVWQFLESRLDTERSFVDGARFLIMRQFGMREALTLDRHFPRAGYVRLPLGQGQDA
jgi:predicted nucleic acid-binding protein